MSHTFEVFLILFFGCFQTAVATGEAWNFSDVAKKKYRLSRNDEGNLDTKARKYTASREPEDVFVAMDALRMLVRYGSDDKKPEYIYCLALLCFNVNDASFKDLYFNEALRLFLKFCGMKYAHNYSVRAPKAIIRAAYSAYSVNSVNLAMELIEILKNEFPAYKQSVIERKMIQRILRSRKNVTAS